MHEHNAAEIAERPGYSGDGDGVVLAVSEGECGAHAVRLGERHACRRLPPHRPEPVYGHDPRVERPGPTTDNAAPGRERR